MEKEQQYGGLLGRVRLGQEAERASQMLNAPNYGVPMQKSISDYASPWFFLQDLFSMEGGGGLFERAVRWAQQNGYQPFGDGQRFVPMAGQTPPGYGDPSAYPYLYNYAQGLAPSMDMSGVDARQQRLMALAQQMGYFTPANGGLLGR
jgi:hypothetical protein